MAAATSVHVVAIIEPIIQHADWFFPEGKFWLIVASAAPMATAPPVFGLRELVQHQLILYYIPIIFFFIKSFSLF